MPDISLLVGTPGNGVPVLIDNKTKKVLTGVSFSNFTVASNSNPELATFSIDPATNAVSASPIAAGSGTVVFSTHASYTDPGDGEARENDFTVTKNFTVALGEDGVTFDVQFS